MTRHTSLTVDRKVRTHGHHNNCYSSRSIIDVLPSISSVYSFCSESLIYIWKCAMEFEAIEVTQMNPGDPHE